MKAIYADIKKKDFDRFRSINIEELRNLKQNIEMLMCQDLSIKEITYWSFLRNEKIKERNKHITG